MIITPLSNRHTANTTRNVYLNIIFTLITDQDCSQANSEVSLEHDKTPEILVYSRYPEL